MLYSCSNKCDRIPLQTLTVSYYLRAPPSFVDRVDIKPSVVVIMAVLVYEISNTPSGLDSADQGQ